MSNLAFEVSQGKNRLLELTDNFLGDKVQVSSSEDFIEAIQLGNYLYLTGEKELSQQVLSQTVYFEYAHNKDTFWDYNQFGIALLYKEFGPHDKPTLDSYSLNLAQNSSLPAGEVGYILDFIKASKGALSQIAQIYDYDEKQIDILSDTICGCNLELRFYYVHTNFIQTPPWYSRMRLFELEKMLSKTSYELVRLVERYS